MTQVIATAVIALIVAVFAYKAGIKEGEATMLTKLFHEVRKDKTPEEIYESLRFKKN